MKMIPTFDPSSAQSGTIQVGLVNRCSGFVLYNESSIGLTLTFRDGSTATLPPWWARSYKVQVAPNPTVDWKFSYSLNSSGSPQSLILGEAYDGNEIVPDVNAPLSRLQNIGNNVSTNVSGTANLTNDANPSGTQIIESTVLGGAASNVSVYNDGTVHIKVLDGGVLTEKVTITPGVSGGAATVLFHGTADTATNATNATNVPASGVSAGNLASGVIVTSKPSTSGTADSANALATTATVNANQLRSGIDYTSNANDVYIKSNSASGGVHFQTSTGTGIGYHDSSGSIHMEGSGSSLYLPDGSKFTRYHGFSGTGSGTYNHLCGTTPTAISLTTNVVGSQTMGYDSLTSTQAHVTCGSTLGWYGESILL